jgi:hypothetical protein
MQTVGRIFSYGGNGQPLPTRCLWIEVEGVFDKVWNSIVIRISGGSALRHR